MIFYVLISCHSQFFDFTKLFSSLQTQVISFSAFKFSTSIAVGVNRNRMSQLTQKLPLIIEKSNYILKRLYIKMALLLWSAELSCWQLPQSL